MKKELITILLFIFIFYQSYPQVQRNTSPQPEEIGKDANDDPSGASVLNLGTTYYAYIDPQGDVDWAKFYIPEAGTIHVLFEVPAGLDYDIELYDYTAPNGFLAGSYNGTGQDETIDYFTNTAGWFYIKRYGYSGAWSATDPYYTTVTHTPTSTTLNCIPDVESIKLNNSTIYAGNTYDLFLNSLNETFELELRGENDGSDNCPAYMGYLTMSFEQFTSSSDKSRVSYGSKSSDISLGTYWGDEAQGGDGFAEYVMVEGTDIDDWNSAESNYYEVNIQPKAWGPFVIHYRMALPTNTSGSSYSWDPFSGNPDPIGEPSYVVTLNIQQTPGTIHIDVTNPDGNPASGVKVLRYTSSWSYEDYEYTDGSGRATWNNIPIGDIFHFEAYNPTPVSNYDEFWGTVTNVSVNNAGGTTYEGIQRYMPYSYQIRINDVNGNPNSSFELGEDVQIIIDVSNDDTQSHNVKVHCQADRDQTSPIDFDETSSYQSFPALVCGWHTFTFTPTEVGDYHVRPKETFTYYNNSDVLTDSWEFSSYVHFTITPPTGNIHIDVTNHLGSPQSDVRVYRFNNNWVFIDEQQTDNNGRASWTNMIPAGVNYHFSAYNPTPLNNDDEYWGYVTDVMVNNLGGTEVASIQRFMPYSYQIRIEDVNGNPQSTFELGQTVKMIIDVSNNEYQSNNVKVHCQADRNQTGSMDFDETSSYQSVPSSASVWYTFTFTPDDPGNYHVRPFETITYSNNSDVLTDSWDFGANSNFTVTQPTGNIHIDVTNHLGNPQSGVRVYRFSDNWSFIDEQQTDNNGRASWTNMIPAGMNYHFSAYNPTPLNNDDEYWGYVTNVMVNNLGGTSVASIQRFMPYSYQIRIEDINGNPQSSFELGQTVQIIIDVSNNEYLANDVKVHCQADRDQTGSMDFDETSNYQSVASYSTSWITFSFTPDAEGDYHVRPFETLTHKNNSDVLTDSWDFGSYVNFTITPSTGTVHIDVKSPSGGLMSEVDVLRYSSNWDYIDDYPTNSNGRASWNSLIPPGVNYHFEAYNPNPNSTDREYWGTVMNVIVNNTGGTTIDEIERYMPYTYQVQTQNQNGDLQTSFELGDEVLMIIDVSNDDVTPHDVKVRCIADRDKTGSMDFEATSSYQNVPGLTCAWHTFSYTPSEIGDYFIRPIETFTYYNNSDVVTDTWAFGTNPNFSITPSIIVTQPSSNQIVNQGDLVEIQWNAGNPAGVNIILKADPDNIYGNGNEIIIEDTGLPTTGTHQWNTANFSPNEYYIVGVAEYSATNFAYDYAPGTVQITGSYNIELELYMISDNTGTPNTTNPGNLKDSFISGETVRVTMMATNTGTSADVQCVLNIRGADDQTWVYDSHTIGQDNSFDSPILNNETDYYSFDWEIPAYYDDFGYHDVGSSIRNEYNFSTLYETTCLGPNTTFNCDWILDDMFNVFTPNYQVLNVPHFYQGHTYWCYIYSLSMLLRYYGYDDKPWEIANHSTFEKSINEGRMGASISGYLEQQHNLLINRVIWSTYNSSTFSNLKYYLINEISNSRPVWLLKVEGIHTIVIVGANENTVYYNDPHYPNLTTIEKSWSDFYDSMLGLFSFCETISINNATPQANIDLSISPYTFANDQVSYIAHQHHLYYAFSSIELTNKLYSNEHHLYLKFDGDDNRPWGYKYVALEYDGQEWIENNYDNYYTSEQQTGYKFTLADHINISSYLSNVSDASRNINFKCHIYECDNDWVPVGDPIYPGVAEFEELIISSNRWIELESEYLDNIGVAKILDKNNDGLIDNSNKQYLIRFQVENENDIVEDIVDYNFYAIESDYAKLYCTDFNDIYNFEAGKENFIPFSIENFGFYNNSQEYPNIDLISFECYSFHIYEDNDNNLIPDGPYLQDTDNDGQYNLTILPVGSPKSFLLGIEVPNDPVLYNTTSGTHYFDVISTIDEIERISNHFSYLILEPAETSIFFNSAISQWQNQNILYDIDFEDLTGITNISYQLNSNDNSNLANWHPITANGITQINQFTGTSFTDNWMISNTDWDDLQLNSQTLGWHYIYFKVEDAAGNVYITPTQDEAFKFGKDEFAPSCHFVSPDNNQIVNSTTVTVEWYVSDILLGLPMSGVNSVFYKIDNEANFTPVDPSITSHTYSNLTQDLHTVYLYATDNAGNQHDVVELVFTVDLNINPPEAFALLSPGDGDLITTLNPTLSWETSIDPDGTTVNYDLWYDYDASFSNAFIESTAGTQFSPTLNDNSIVYWKVKAIDESGEVTWSNQLDWSFIVNTQNDPPQAFNLNEPANTSTTNSWAPYFDWTNSIDPDPGDNITYFLWVGTDPLFNAGSYAEYQSYDSENSDCGLLYANTTYYWKVKAVDDAGVITWSSETDWWFMTPNHAPEFVWTGSSGYESDGVNPDEGDNTTNFTFSITYKDEDENAPASGYPLLHIFKDGFELSNSPFVMDEANTNSFQTGREYTYDDNLNLDPGIDYTYYFEAIDDYNGIATGNGTSSVIGPEVKGLELNTPDGGELWYSNQNYNIEWEFIGGFDSYDIIYSTDDGQTYLSIETGISGNISFYEWIVPNTPSLTCRVSIIGHYNTYSVSDTSEFTFEIHEPIDPPTPFSLLYPYDVELTTTTPTFLWDPSVDPDGTIVTYEIWYGTDENYVNKITEGNIQNPEYTPFFPLTDNSKYYWKVKAEDENGQATWSSQQDWFFYVNVANNAPNAFSLLQPENTITISTLNPEFKWSASYDVDPIDTISYTLWVGENNQFTTGTYSEYTGIETTEFTLSSPLNINTYYYWKVKAVDNHGAETWCFEDYWWFQTPSCSPLSPGQISSAQTICYNAIPQGISLTSNPGGGSGNISYQWQESFDDDNYDDILGEEGVTYQAPALIQSTYYRLKFIDPGSCGDVFSDAILISVYDELIPSQITGDQTICYSDNPVDIITSAIPTGGFGTYTTVWQGSVNFGPWTDITGANGSTYNPGPLTDTSSYRQLITDPCGFAYSNEITINVVPLPTSDAGNDTIICEDITLLLDQAVAEYYSSVLWSGGTGTFNDPTIVNASYTPSQTDIDNGSVVLTLDVDAISPCTGSVQSSLLVTIQKLPEAFAGYDTTICENQVLNILTSSASYYTSLMWSGGSGTFNDPTLLMPIYQPDPADILAGTITLTLTANPTAPCGIASAAAFDLSFQELPLADAGPDATICEDGSYQPPATAFDYYSLLWTTSGDGSFNDSTIISPVYTPSYDDILAGYVYLKLLASAISPCTVYHEDSMLLTFQYLPIADAGPDTANICEDMSYQANGTPLYESSVEWSTFGTGTFNNININNPVYTPSPADISNGSVMLTFTAMATSPCSVNHTDSILLLIQYLPTADAGVDTTICEGSPYTLPAFATNIGSVLWETTGTGNFDDSTLLNATYTPSYLDAIYSPVYLTLTIYPIAPCDDSAVDMMTLGVNNLPVAEAGIDDTICENATNYTISGFTTGWSPWFQWTTVPGQAFGTLQNPQSYTPSYIIDSLDVINGSFSLVLTAFPQNPPCTEVDRDTLTVYFADLPDADAGADGITCEIDGFPVSGIANNYSGVEWTKSGDGTFEDPYILNTIYYPGADDALTGSVILTLTAFADPPCSIDASDDLILQVIPLPEADAGENQTICVEDSCQLDGSASNYNNVVWNTALGDGTFINPDSLDAIYVPGPHDIISGVAVVTLHAFSISPCTGEASDEMAIFFHESPVADAGTSVTIIYGNSYTLQGDVSGGSGNYSVHWEPAALLNNPNILNPLAQNLTGTTIFTLTATDQETGCADADNVSITVNPHWIKFEINGGVSSNTKNLPVEGVMITFGAKDTAYTDANGLYTGSVQSGWSGYAVPNYPGYIFEPDSILYEYVGDNIMGQEYNGILFVEANAFPRLVCPPGGPTLLYDTLYCPQGEVTYTWTSDQQVGPISHEPSFTHNALVSTTYKLTVEDEYDISYDTVFVDVCTSVYIDGYEDLVIEVFPNPVRNTLHIRCTGIKGPLRMTLMDLNGITIFNDKVTGEFSKYDMEIDMSPYAAGIYLFKVLSSEDDFIKVEKIVKLK